MKPRTVVAVAVAFFCLALASNLYAQSNDDAVAKVKQLQNDELKAMMSHDASWAQQHLADGYVEGHSWGEWTTKAAFIKELQDQTNKWKSANISDLQVATFGPDTAISHYKLTYDATFNGTHRARSVICSDTWVNDSGTWKVASAHCSVALGK